MPGFGGSDAFASLPPPSHNPLAPPAPTECNGNDSKGPILDQGAMDVGLRHGDGSGVQSDDSDVNRPSPNVRFSRVSETFRGSLPSLTQVATFVKAATPRIRLEKLAMRVSQFDPSSSTSSSPTITQLPGPGTSSASSKQGVLQSQSESQNHQSGATPPKANLPGPCPPEGSDASTAATSGVSSITSSLRDASLGSEPTREVGAVDGGGSPDDAELYSIFRKLEVRGDNNNIHMVLNFKIDRYLQKLRSTFEFTGEGHGLRLPPSDQLDPQLAKCPGVSAACHILSSIKYLKDSELLLSKTKSLTKDLKAQCESRSIVMNFNTTVRLEISHKVKQDLKSLCTMQNLPFREPFHEFRMLLEWYGCVESEVEELSADRENLNFQFLNTVKMDANPVNNLNINRIRLQLEQAIGSSLPPQPLAPCRGGRDGGVPELSFLQQQPNPSLLEQPATTNTSSRIAEISLIFLVLLLLATLWRYRPNRKTGSSESVSAESCSVLQRSTANRGALKGTVCEVDAQVCEFDALV